VISDEETATSRGVTIRRVRFHDAASERTFSFLTTLPVSVPPGLVAMLYARRWDVEKVFDEVKNKLGESKAWATSPSAKNNHAGLLCLTHNLLTLLESEIASTEGIVNTPELRRKAKARAALVALTETSPSPLRFTVRTVKFIRWVRNHLDSPASWSNSLAHLARVYATF
jgi:hypothetical protein